MKWFYISTKASTVMMMLVLISPSQYYSIIGSAFRSNDTNERDNSRGAITTSTTTSSRRTIAIATSRTSTAASADSSSPKFEKITKNYNKHDNNYYNVKNIPWLFSFHNNAVSLNKDTPVPVPANTTTSGGAPSQSPSVALNPSAPPSNNTNTTKVPTASPMPSISSAPSSSHKYDNTTSHVPTSSPSLYPTFANVTTHKPSISNAPTVIPGPGTNPPDTTSKPTKKYTTSPTVSPNHFSVAPTLPSHGGRKRHGFVYNLSKFIFWVFMSMVAFLACGKIMSHRTQIYFVLCQIWYKLKYYLSRFFNRVQDVCSRLGAMGFLHKVGDLFARVGGWIMGWIGQVRGRAFGGRGGRGGGTGGRGGGLVDDDGSTMMQGLLMRENV